jgi:hypothetical protein
MNKQPNLNINYRALLTREMPDLKPNGKDQASKGAIRKNEILGYFESKSLSPDGICTGTDAQKRLSSALLAKQFLIENKHNIDERYRGAMLAALGDEKGVISCLDNSGIKDAVAAGLTAAYSGNFGLALWAVKNLINNANKIEKECGDLDPRVAECHTHAAMIFLPIAHLEDQKENAKEFSKLFRKNGVVGLAGIIAAKAGLREFAQKMIEDEKRAIREMPNKSRLIHDQLLDEAEKITYKGKISGGNSSCTNEIQNIGLISFELGDYAAVMKAAMDLEGLEGGVWSAALYSKLGKRDEALKCLKYALAPDGRAKILAYGGKPYDAAIELMKPGVKWRAENALIIALECSRIFAEPEAALS